MPELVDRDISTNLVTMTQIIRRVKYRWWPQTTNEIIKDTSTWKA
jgi:hypothetical protein